MESSDSRPAVSRAKCVVCCVCERVHSYISNSEAERAAKEKEEAAARKKAMREKMKRAGTYLLPLLTDTGLVCVCTSI